RPSAAFGILLTVLGHLSGWPIAKGGSHKVSMAMANYFTSLGGQIFTGVSIRTIDELPDARVVLCDVTPRQLLDIAGRRFTPTYRAKLKRYRYGPGIFKMDWALHQPIPWKASECRRAGTVHVGGTFTDIAKSEAAVHRGEHPETPFVLLSQPS